MKNTIKNYLTFSRKELIIFLLLVFLIGGFIYLPSILPKKESKVLDKQFIERIILPKKDTQRYKNKFKDESDETYFSEKSTLKKTLTPFNFNPNNLDQAGWTKLGLRPKTIATILKYVSKGGRFKTPEDIRKIWGLREEEASVLIPFIVIPESSNNYDRNKFSTNSFNKNYSVANTKATIIDINLAAINDFKTLPAIGNMAYKIFNFREKLGGFISVSQVKETYGLTDSLYAIIAPYLKLTAPVFQKLNINIASDFELSKHPYVSKEVGKAIVIYRNQHGKYNSIEEVKKIVFIKKEVYDKLSPYITVE